MYEETFLKVADTLATSKALLNLLDSLALNFVEKQFVSNWTFQCNNQHGLNCPLRTRENKKSTGRLNSNVVPGKTS